MTRTQGRSEMGFTLAELLITIAIIVVLVGILLPALNSARKKARDIATRAQLDSIGKANESYKLAFGDYAGYVDDSYWNSNNEFTATQNLLVSLMGRVVGSSGSNTVQIPNTASPVLYVDKDKVGSGPITAAGQTYGAFYPAKSEELATEDDDGNPQLVGTNGNDNTIPVLVDASYGLPLLYFRAGAGWTQPASDIPNNGGAFFLNGVSDYVQATALSNTRYGTRQYDQANESALATGSAVTNLAFLTVNPNISILGANKDSPNDNTDDVPGGGFYLMATGFDRIYFSNDQVGGDGIDSIDEVDNFDDIIVSGGTAP